MGKDYCENPGDRVYVPDFVFPDGNTGDLIAKLRGCGPDGYIDQPRHVTQFAVYTEPGDYYGIWADSRKKNRLKHTTIAVGDKNFNYPIIGFYTYSVKCNPKNGHGVPCKCPECQEGN